MGASPIWFAYDNERPQHVREVAAFRNDVLPVTNGQMRKFVEDGGYGRPESGSKQLVVAREEERRRLRRDLHDGLGPALAAIGMRAEASAAVLDEDPETARRQLDALSVEVREALADVRRLVDGLRPPALDELGLAGAIGHQAARLDRGSGRGGPAGDPGTAASTSSASRSPARAARRRRGRRLPDRGRRP